MFNLFRKTESEEELEMLRTQKTELEKEIKSLKEEVAGLKLKKKIEDEDIRHMVKIKQEALEIEHKKKNMDVEAAKNAEIAECKDAYRDKMEMFLQKQVQDVKEMYAQILKRLPDVNVRLKGDV